MKQSKPSVIVTALYNNQLILTTIKQLPTFQLETNETIDAVVKINMLRTHGAVIKQTRPVGTFNGNIVYAAHVIQITPITYSLDAQTQLITLTDAARLLFKCYGTKADNILTKTLKLCQQDKPSSNIELF